MFTTMFWWKMQLEKERNKNFSYYSAMLIHNSSSFEEVIIQNVPLFSIFSFQNLCVKQTEIIEFQM